MIKNSVND